MYDIAIIGSGPCGATLARLIGKKYKVLVIDKRTLDKPPSGIVKCCGGLIAPDAQKVIAELGMGLPKEVLTGPQLFSVRAMDLKYAVERYYQRFYINIDREKFDRWLVSQIPEGVELKLGSMFKGFKQENGHISVTYTSGGKTYEEKVRLLFGADGSFSNVRRMLGIGLRPESHYVSVQEWFETEKVLPYFSAIFDEDITDFYSWTIPKGNYMLLGSAIPYGSDVCRKFELLKTKLSDVGFEFSRRVKREGAFITRPLSLKDISIGMGNIALVGEAGGFISPSSSEGISYALESAYAAAKSLEDGMEGFFGRYSKNICNLKLNIFLKNVKSPFMYNKALRRLIMSSALLSIGVMDKDIALR